MRCVDGCKCGAYVSDNLQTFLKCLYDHDLYFRVLMNVHLIGKWRYVKDNTMVFCKKKPKKKYVWKIWVLYPSFVFSLQPQEIKDLREFLSLTTCVIQGIKEVGEIFYKHDFFSFIECMEIDNVLMYNHIL